MPRQFPKELGQELIPWTGPSIWDAARTGAEQGATYFEAKAWQHASRRVLNDPLRSSVFCSLMKNSKFLEEASGPGYILTTGVFAWLEDVLIERPEGSCRPFSWE